MNHRAKFDGASFILGLGGEIVNRTNTDLIRWTMQTGGDYLSGPDCIYQSRACVIWDVLCCSPCMCMARGCDLHAPSSPVGHGESAPVRRPDDLHTAGWLIDLNSLETVCARTGSCNTVQSNGIYSLYAYRHANVRLTHRSSEH